MSNKEILTSTGLLDILRAVRYYEVSFTLTYDTRINRRSCHYVHQQQEGWLIRFF